MERGTTPSQEPHLLSPSGLVFRPFGPQTSAFYASPSWSLGHKMLPRPLLVLSVIRAIISTYPMRSLFPFSPLDCIFSVSVQTIDSVLLLLTFIVIYFVFNDLCFVCFSSLLTWCTCDWQSTSVAMCQPLCTLINVISVIYLCCCSTPSWAASCAVTSYVSCICPQLNFI